MEQNKFQLGPQGADPSSIGGNNDQGAPAPAGGFAGFAGVTSAFAVVAGGGGGAIGNRGDVDGGCGGVVAGGGSAGGGSSSQSAAVSAAAGVCAASAGVCAAFAGDAADFSCGSGVAAVGGSAAVAAGCGGGDDVGAAGGSSSQSSIGRKRGNYRHNQQQIYAMEGYFKDIDPHPNEIQRNELAKNLGLEPAQVKSWFQNKRSQLKAKKLKSTSVPAASEFRRSIIQLVVSAADELNVMAIAVGKFWIRSIADGSTSELNEEEYLENFAYNFGPTRLGYTCEASRHISRVLLNPRHLLKILMNVNEWSLIFSAIVSSAVTMEVLSEGVDYNGALHVISAEYHLPTPLVPNRQSYFARYCTQHCEGVWSVVDVSLDNIIPTLENTTCQKRPSGCLIQEMSDGTSKITWIEHVYVDYQGISSMYQHLLLAGLGFGAKRWVSILQRQCQRLTTANLAIATSTDFNNLVMSSPQGRWGILELAERMVNNFTFGITSPKTGKWTKWYTNFRDDIRLMSTRVMDEPGLPNGTLLSVSTSFSLSLAPKMVFDFFSDHRSRKEWDIFANGNDYQPVCRISYGEEASSCVSIYKVPMRMHGHMLVLQESWSDPVASHIVFAPTEIGTIDMILGGGNPNSIPLLPSGFTILPDGPSFRTEGSRGTLLTVSCQVLMNKSPAVEIDDVAVSKVAHFLRCFCEKIKLALGALGPHTST